MLCERIRKIVTSRAFRITLSCIFWLIVVVIVFIFCANAYVIGRTKDRILTVKEASALESVDCVLVLGAGLRRDGTPSDMLRDRLQLGIDLYDAGVHAPYLMSGDNRTDDYNEVGAMQSWLLERGLPEGMICVDPLGLCTYDSLCRLSQSGNTKKIIIVTQKYHLYRALYIAESLGFEAYGVDASLNTYFGQVWRDLREVAARVKDLWLCFFKCEATRTDALPVISRH